MTTAHLSTAEGSRYREKLDVKKLLCRHRFASSHAELETHLSHMDWTTVAGREQAPELCMAGAITCTRAGLQRLQELLQQHRHREH